MFSVVSDSFIFNLSIVIHTFGLFFSCFCPIDFRIEYPRNKTKKFDTFVYSIFNFCHHQKKTFEMDRSNRMFSNFVHHYRYYRYFSPKKMQLISILIIIIISLLIDCFAWNFGETSNNNDGQTSDKSSSSFFSLVSFFLKWIFFSQNVAQVDKNFLQIRVFQFRQNVYYPEKKKFLFAKTIIRDSCSW